MKSGDGFVSVKQQLSSIYLWGSFLLCGRICWSFDSSLNYRLLEKRFYKVTDGIGLMVIKECRVESIHHCTTGMVTMQRAFLAFGESTDVPVVLFGLY